MRTVTTRESRLVPVADGALEVFVGGSAGPVLCEAPHPVVPGITAPCGPLNGLGRLVRMSPRGAGRSSPWLDPQDVTIERLADDLEAVRLELGLGPWVVFGHSAGGFVALEYARRYPATSAGLVLVATPLSLRRVYADPRSRNSALHPQWQPALAAYRSSPAPAGVFRVERVRTDLWVALQGHRLLTMLPVSEVTAVLTARLVAALAFDAGAWLGELRTPTLILWGRADDIVPLSHGEALRAGIPGAELVVFETSRHAPFVDQPEPYRATVAGFLARRVARVGSPGTAAHRRPNV